MGRCNKETHRDEIIEEWGKIEKLRDGVIEREVVEDRTILAMENDLYERKAIIAGGDLELLKVLEEKEHKIEELKVKKAEFFDVFENYIKLRFIELDKQLEVLDEDISE